jgi:FkbM family methyltransferase
MLWNLDLTEGIDFSIFLLGGFEPRTLKLYAKLVKQGATVLDIGANVGAHTLPLAELVGPQGRVIAFEPTRYALEKMRANIALNTDLTNRIALCQAMLVADDSKTLTRQVYSSWPLFGKSDTLHAQHRGQLMETDGATAVTLDRAVSDMKLSRIDFIKLDVDGQEPAVLAGAKKTLSTYQPPILLELAPYLYAQAFDQFEQMMRTLAESGYVATEVDSKRELPLDARKLAEVIPSGGSSNVLLEHRPSRSRSS